MMAVAEEVRSAQAGDRLAFGRLVARFQDMAVGYALGWLGDPESARDAAQDAFIDAYLHLAQLQDPAAFPGWFRRIVMKHCDRRTRRKPAPSIEIASMKPLEDQVADREQRDSLRRAIESLPEHERIVVALHYLGDEPQQEVADFLELPLSTVKKRLHSARKRLERRIEMEAHRPSRARTFADRIQLFLAIRAGDVDAAAAIVDAHSELLEAEEQWTAEEALAGGFPLAHRLTPLIAASARGDRAMVEMLLAKGARVDGTCGCGNRETALWTAALHGRTEVARALLERGADPNASNAIGHTAASLAAMRGHRELLKLLSRHGGATDLRDWTRPRAAAIGARIETGIRAVDLLSPLAPGMLVRVHGAAETGLMVLLAELARRFGDVGLRSVWVGQADHEMLAAELGISDCTTVVRDLERIDGEAVFVFVEAGRTAEIEAVLKSLLERAMIVFVIDPWIQVTRGDCDPPSLGAPYGAVIQTSRTLAEEGIFPAIDPKSDSILEVSEEHERLRARVRANYDRPEVRAVISQPFFTWQHQNGLRGEVTPLRETLERFLRSTR